MTHQPQIAVEYRFDLDATLRGLLLLSGLPKEEIDARLRARQVERQSETTHEQVN